MDKKLFRRSSFCTDAHGCVEVAICRDQIEVRDAKDVSTVSLTFSPSEWNAFVEGVKAGEFDVHD